MFKILLVDDEPITKSAFGNYLKVLIILLREPPAMVQRHCCSWKQIALISS